MKLVFATNNPNKIREVQQIVPTHIKLVSLREINCVEDIPETQDTIEGNAIEKAQYIKQNYGYDCFADDTGLEINALDGEPGVYSARYAGPQRNADDNMQKVLKNLEGEKDRTAKFKTVIALIISNKLYTFEGTCKGQITTTKQGDYGFGYDPIFQPYGYSETFAQMDASLKNKIGHRGLAINKLIDFLKG